MKLWDKGYSTDAFVEEFTVGRDRELDLYLAEADVLGNMAHTSQAYPDIRFRDQTYTPRHRIYRDQPYVAKMDFLFP